MDWKLETVVVPVADVDRAKAFYADGVGFHVDVDHRAGEDFRVVQLTPPGSGCSITLMKNEQAAGSLQGLHLVVRDIDEARRQLDDARRGRPATSSTSRRACRSPGPTPTGPTTDPSSRSAIPTGTGGSCRRSQQGRDAAVAGPDQRYERARSSTATTSAVGCGGPSASTQRTSM